MSNTLKYAALAAFIGATGAAHADPAETKGGIKIKTEDGRFEANIGGRIHFDGNLINTDDGAAFGSAGTQNDGFYLRRVYLTLKGKAYGWNYKIEPDFAGNNGTGAASIAFQDVYLSTQVGPGELIFGQIKPFRAMEELTSSNDILMMERPYASAAAVFGGGVSREFQQGIFYKGEFLGAGTYGIGGYSLRRDNSASNQGFGSSARGTFAPIMDDHTVLHVGASYSYESQDAKGASDAGGNPAAIGTAVRYLSRRGPTLNLGAAGGDGNTGNSRVAQTIGGELAGKFGPAYMQSEYMSQKLDQAAGVRAQYVTAWYVQGSYFITGETKGYKKSDGVFGGAIKPNNSFGAFEVKARYDRASNSATAITGQTYGKASADAITAGVNWYPNPNVRFMFEYIDSTAERTLTATGVKQKDKPSAVAMRAQFSF